MASKTLFFLVFSIISLSLLHFSAGQNVVKAAYWFPESGFAASSINSTLFTHLFCAFANIDSQTKQVTISAANNASFAQFTRTVQVNNPSVKTLLSIGGGNADSTVFASMASQATSRQAFINSSLKLARSYGFSGVDLDWEYPLVAADMTNMGTLLDEWRTAAIAESTSSGKPPMNITAAVSVLPRVNGLNYPTQSISRSLDWINIMAYDFYGPNWGNNKLTRSHAALNDSSGQVSGSAGIAAWVGAGIGLKKLVLGLPFYGYAYRLVNASNHGLLAPSNGSAVAGDGAMGYNQIRVFISNNAAPVVYNATLVTHYCYSGTTWIGYDDNQTISTKVLYAKQQGLLGYFAWHVGVDNNWALSQTAKQAWGA